jgi:hypothetical protein
MDENKDKSTLKNATAGVDAEAQGAGDTVEEYAEITDRSEKKSKKEKLDKSGSAKKRKRLIVLGVIAIFIAAAGIGVFQWHEQPSFCGAICHTPMDSYVASYNEEPGTAGVDRYNNAIANTNGMMAIVHKEESVDCLDCHAAAIGEQITEGMNWITGNYEYPMKERKLSDLAAARGLNNSDEFCLNDSCHHMAGDGSAINTREDLIAATFDLTRNVHLAQHEVQQCSNCHKSHSASTVPCSQCHSDTNIPEGWLSDAQYQQQIRER